jgi:hypothetical protein
VGSKDFIIKEHPVSFTICAELGRLLSRGRDENPSRITNQKLKKVLKE